MFKAAVIPAMLAASVVCAPLSHAGPGGDQGSLQRSWAEAGGPFIGDWGAHKERVVVNSDGSGTETYSGGTMTFRLGSVQTSSTPWDTAYGNVVSGGNGPVGAYVTMQLVDGGNGMLFSSGGGDQGFPFCKFVGGTVANRNDCGA